MLRRITRFRLDGLASKVRALSRTQQGVAGSLILTLLIGGAVGMHRTYDYVQHDNEFCVSCHLMEIPYERFRASEHRDLSCKACHTPTNIQRARMALTQVVEWPQEIRAHAIVPNGRCEQCHVEGDPKRWRQIGQTAGHRAHLESKDPALSSLECVTCHSVGVHQFAPTDAVCGRAGCHEEVEVRLGGMREMPPHCVACHEFTRPVPRSARRTRVKEDGHLLVPTVEQCLRCHEMQELVSVAPEKEPHGAVCGTCHDAHSQEVGQEAVKSCTSAGCHENPGSFPNLHHRWPSVRLSDCTRCHTAHDFVVTEDDCVRCHAKVLTGPRTGMGDTPPPAARLLAMTYGEPGTVHGPAASVATNGPLVLAGIEPLPAEAPQTGPGLGAAAQQAHQRAFEHDRHRTVACRQCHTSERPVPALNPAWCESCHHGARSGVRCERCHSAALQSARPIELAFRLPGGPSQRKLSFQHAPHRRLDCVRCHGTPPKRITQPNCDDCHTEHHGGQTACTSCHAKPPGWAHEPAVVHTSCGQGGAVCHSHVAEGVEPERRAVCLACHPEFPRDGPLPAMPRKVAIPPSPRLESDRAMRGIRGEPSKRTGVPWTR